MKALMNWQRVLYSIAISGILFCTACSDPVADEEGDINDTTKVITPDVADKISESFQFRNSTKITGNVPQVVNSSLVKTNSGDTIYTMPGLKMPIRISHPESAGIGGWFVTVRGSTFYYHVSIDDEEDSDTVSVVIVSIDPGDIELPYDIPLEITPYDQNKLPVDIITRIVTVEEPSSGGCDIRIDGDTLASNRYTSEWVWYSTEVFDTKDSLKFINAPHREFAASQPVVGCCADSTVCPQAIYNPVTKATDLVYDSKATAKTSYSIGFESFAFFKNGTFERFTVEYIKNFSYKATNWCSGVVGYNNRISDVLYYGTHDYVPGKANISYFADHKICADPLGICGYGSRPGQLVHTCKVMAIIVDKLMLEGTQEIRIYMRQWESDVWKD